MKKLALLCVFYSSLLLASAPGLPKTLVHEPQTYGSLTVIVLEKGNYKVFEIQISSRRAKINTFLEFYDAPGKSRESQINSFTNAITIEEHYQLLNLPYAYVNSERAKVVFNINLPFILDLFKKDAPSRETIAPKLEPKDQKLFDAVRKNSVTDLRIALEDKANVNAADEYGSTPIIVAARRGLLAIAKELSDHGALLDFRTAKGDTALFEAAEANDIKFLEFLLDKGVSIETEDKSGRTLLEFFALRNNKNMVKKLLQRKASILHKNPHFGVSLLVRINTFAQMDHSYKEMSDLIKQALKEQMQAQKEEAKRQSPAPEESVSRMSPAAAAGAGAGRDEQVGVNAKFTEAHEAEQCGSSIDDKERQARIAEYEKAERDAELARVAQEKAARLARHAQRSKEKKVEPKGSPAATARQVEQEKHPEKNTGKKALYKDFAIVYSEKAEQQKQSLSKSIIETISQKIDAYKNGEKQDVKKIVSKASKETEWRLRVGDYRVFFTVNDQEKKINIERIVPRDDAY